MAAGQANGRPKGSVKRGASKSTASSKTKGKPGPLKWTLHNVARLAIWYTIITALFRCPTSLDEVGDDTPRVCAPYLQARSRIDPYARPYYDQYVEPYTQAAKPYYDQFHKHVYTPFVVVVKSNYEKYGASQVEVAQAYTLNQWEKSVKPQLDTLSTQAKVQYDKNLAPHVEKMSPYVETTRDNVQDMYNKQVLPAYQAVQPHVNTAVSQAQKHWTNTGKPYSIWAWNTSWGFLNRTIWPRIRVLYGENVEPQLIRITERLGRYKDEQKIKAAVEEFEEPASPEDPEGTHNNPAHSVVSSSLADDATSDQSEPSQAPETDEEREARVKASIQDDLTNWKAGWDRAAARGIEDLRERVAGIAEKQTKSQIDGVGRSHITELEETSSAEIADLKSSILKIVRSFDEESTEEDEKNAIDEVGRVARQAGSVIRIKAQTLRGWHQRFNSDTHNLVEAAATNALEVIDGIRNLGLQEIGMRWTSLGDSVTYKDWARYHDVKKEYSKTRKQIEDVAMDHPDYAAAKAAAEDVEAVGMGIAEDVAKELVRLKAVGIWKVEAGDGTDNFETKNYPPRAKGVSRKKVSEAVAHASDSVKKAASKASENIIGTEPGIVDNQNSVVADNVESVKSVVSKAKEAVTGSAKSKSKPTQNFPPLATDPGMDKFEAVKQIVMLAQRVGMEGKEKGESAASVASEAIIGSKTPAAEAAASKISEKVIGSETPIYESAASKASSSVDSVLSDASEAIMGGKTPAYKSAASAVSEAIVGSEQPAHESVVSKAGVVMEDFYAKVSKAAAEASAAGSSSLETASEAASSIIESASSSVSSVVSGEVKSDNAMDAFLARVSKEAAEASKSGSDSSEAVSRAASSASDSASSAVKSASSSVSSAASKASKSASSSVSSASSKISKSAKSSQSLGLEMEAFYAKVSKAAAEAASSNDAKSSSSAAASKSKVFAGAMAQSVSAREPILDHEFDMDDYNEKVSSALSSANSRYSEMTKAVSEALLKPSQTKGAVENLQKVVEERYAKAMQVASEALYGKEPSTGEKVAEAANSRYVAAVSAASSIFYGTPTPMAESLGSQAQGQYRSGSAAAQSALQSISALASSRLADGVSIASEQFESAKTAVGATPTPAHQKYVDEAQKRYYQGVGLAHERYSSFVNQASIAAFGPPTGSPESIASVVSGKAASVASKASSNWQDLVNQASEQVYGQPTPWYESAYSQAGEYGAQATSQAAEQYAAVVALISEMVQGKEPEFTESVMSRLSSAYHTGVPEVASSVSSVIADGYSSAASAMSSIFVTPSARLEEIFDRANDQIQAAVDVASAQVYGTTPGYAEKAQSSVSAAAESASSAISVAIYGTPTGAAEAATSKVAEVYKDAAKAAAKAADSASAKASEAIYGPEKGAVESAQSRLNEAVESAKAQLSSMAADAGESAGEALSKASEAVEDMASSVGSAAGAATNKGKDEL